MNKLLFLGIFLISGCSTSGQFLSSSEEGWFNYQFNGKTEQLVYCTSRFDKKIKPRCYIVDVYQILENKND